MILLSMVFRDSSHSSHASMSMFGVGLDPSVVVSGAGGLVCPVCLSCLACSCVGVSVVLARKWDVVVVL
jgi:hypothetical protein